MKEGSTEEIKWKSNNRRKRYFKDDNDLYPLIKSGRRKYVSTKDTIEWKKYLKLIIV